LNVTIPYKQLIIPYLNDLSEEAQAIGAVNVIRITRNGKKLHLKGFNSDVIGFVKSIQSLLEPHHKKALILGCTGGASKAVRYGLETKLNLEVKGVSRRPSESNITYKDVTPELLEEYTVIVNCTPSGMYPHVNECPELPYEALTSKHLLYDLIYNPEETLFLQKGAQQGAKIKNGMEMLLLQAIASWEIWNK
jgi:shikimate dehydrogenase